MNLAFSPGEWAALGSLLVVTLVTAAVPGPSIFLVMRSGGRLGRSAAIAAALGTTVACIAMVGATALGVAKLLAQMPALYTALRIGGGLYLLWFAALLWRGAPAFDAPGNAPRTVKPFRQAVLIGLTNPKGILYFASVFAPFMGPERPASLRLAAAAVVVLTCLAWYGAVAIAFSVVTVALLYRQYGPRLDRLAALFLGLFGLALITDLL